ncbi:MAG: ectoine hydroxylase-related dioxygenase (phytanoyl-CoA dioxygenase family) [Hyphomicrobiaceae bacterium]|jgi:ectoine hydroxylase-related dioxygenase (phytanoyl-CoA dioxygenase family)
MAHDQALLLDERCEQIARDGYTIVEDAIELALLDELEAALTRLELELQAKPAGNRFEGAHTVRIYNLLARGKVFENVPVHPMVLPIVESVLDRECLVSSLSSIAIDKGELAQPIHADDQLMPITKPHRALVCNSMWALTDFTESNGATRIVPGSHLLDQSPHYGSDYDSIPAEMARGSVLIWHGSLWHGGGANRTKSRRTGLAMNYCAGFVRQQENQLLGIPREIARGFGSRLRQLVGYGVYGGLIGHIDKHDPVEMLDTASGSGMVWDAEPVED